MFRMGYSATMPKPFQMAVPVSELLDTDGVPEVTMVMPLPILLFDGTLNENADVVPFFSVYQLPFV